MGDLFLKLVNMSITASWIVLAVVVLRFLMKKAPKWINCILWGIVGLRLIMPFSLESIFSLIPSTETIDNTVYQARPYIQTGVSFFDNRANEYLGSHYYEGVTVPTNNFGNFVEILSVVWIAGMIVMATYSIVSYIILRRKVRVTLCHSENIFFCDNIDSPFILGIFMPHIYLPSGMSEENVDYVIRHEKAHLKRKDHLWKPLGFLLLSVYWFNPVMWIAYILLCRDIELACDEKAVREMDYADKKGYAEALVACSIRRRMVCACPLAFGEVGVKHRIKLVLHYKKPVFWIMIVAVVTCIICAVCFLTNPIGTIESSLSTNDSADGPETVTAEVIRSLKEKYPEYFGLNTSKGLEVYVWQMAAGSYSCGLLSGKNLEHSNEELWSLKPATMEEMRLIVASYQISQSSVVIRPIGMPHSSYLYEINDDYQEKIEEMFWNGDYSASP